MASVKICKYILQINIVKTDIQDIYVIVLPSYILALETISQSEGFVGVPAIRCPRYPRLHGILKAAGVDDSTNLLSCPH